MFPTFEKFKKRLSSLVRRCGDILYNASNMKRIIFLSRLHVDPSHLREHKFNQTLLASYNRLHDHVLLYVDVSFLFTENNSILMHLSVEYILATKSFNTPLVIDA